MSNYKTLNKGEWSEVYAFLKIMSDARLKGVDENLNFTGDSVAVVSIAKTQIGTSLPLLYSIGESFISFTL